MIPPWLEAHLAQIAAMGPRMPHAVLLYGQAGIGKLVLGRAVARTLLCETLESGLPMPGGCGHCPGCLWFDQGSHPDFRAITSEALALAEGIELADEGGDIAEAETGASRSKRAPSREIKVDQIRALHAFLAVATHRRRSRVVLINPVEAVNDVAANALLKMLEEPPSRTVFLLVADHLGRIPATVLSRCHKVYLATPPEATAIGWLGQQGVREPEAVLALSGGAPLAALALARDTEALTSHRELVAFLARPGTDAAMAAAEAFGRVPLGPSIRWIQLWMADCIAMRTARRIRYHPAQSRVIAQLVDLVQLDALMDLMQRLSAVRRSIDHPLNARLVLEGFLLAYSDVMASALPSPIRP